GFRCLWRAEAFRRERAPQYEQEGEEATQYVEAVESSCEVERRPETRVLYAHPVLHHFGVFKHLATDEEGTHEVGEGEPLVQAPLSDFPQAPHPARLEPLGGPHAELTRHG